MCESSSNILIDFSHTAPLFDFQVNGFAGVDFQQKNLKESDVLHATNSLVAHRTGSILLTLITDRFDSLCDKLAHFESLRASNEHIRSVVKGYHLEGPWISTEPGYFGAHPVEHVLVPTDGDYRRLVDASNGNIRLVTVAPEVKGCLPLIEMASRDGIRVSIGHSNASDKIIDDAIVAGATLATHLGNAVPLMLHRHDNIVQRLLARDELIACLIPDGIHLPPTVLQNFFRAKPRDRVFFTTDCMAAAGAGVGSFTIGPHTVEVGIDGIVRLPGESRFAGSSLTMDEAVSNIQKWLGLDLESATSICSTRPARFFGIND